MCIGLCCGAFLLMIVYNRAFLHFILLSKQSPDYCKNSFRWLFDRRYRSVCCFCRLFHVASFIHCRFPATATAATHAHRHLVVWVCVLCERKSNTALFGEIIIYFPSSLLRIAHIDNGTTTHAPFIGTYGGIVFDWHKTKLKIQMDAFVLVLLCYCAKQRYQKRKSRVTSVI